VKDFLALRQPKNEIPAGLENHRCHGKCLFEKDFFAIWLPENAFTDGLKNAWRHGTWLREKEC